ncbi:Rpn family recombination-promoting nuclease/putative transposase [Paenibacillus hodogayensis]|uniref:Rpn family recombination-promoting nuclease/putative transposase n=1 Tax=Paenibacillus hodogayensis TaxID=279208 RepID=A0ABV5VRJ3_9BACL
MNDPLHRWMLFLDERLSEEQVKELTRMDPVIRKTEERLEWLSNDAETIRLYEAREHARIELNSMLADKEQQGIEKGIEKGKVEVALEMLRDGLELEVVARFTKLPIEELRRLDAHNRK